MGYRTVIGAALAALLVAGCQTGSSPSASSGPPPGATVWQAGAPPPGSRFEYETVRGEETSTSVVAIDGVETDPETGRTLVTGTRSNHRFAMAAETGAIVRWEPIGGGEPSARRRNDTGWLDAPVWVGKRWTQSYDWTDPEVGRTWRGVESLWTAAGTETVTTPAGTFETVLLESRPGRNNASRERIWYAPDLGMMVKREFIRTAGNYQGTGRMTRTLISMELPETGDAGEAS